MKRLTTNILTEDILNQLDFETFVKYGGEKEKLVKVLNDIYQYHPKCFVKTNKRDYNFLKEVMAKKINLIKYGV